MDAVPPRPPAVRDDLHLGVGFLAATSGITARGGCASTASPRAGDDLDPRAGAGEPVVLLLHGLGGTKASFLPTVAALADSTG